MFNILDASIHALHPPLLDTPLSFIFTQKEDTTWTQGLSGSVTLYCPYARVEASVGQ